MTVLLAAHGEVATPSLAVEVALELRAGEVVGLVGPNGAGKSATIAGLLGLLPLHGTLVGPGAVALSSAPHARGLGWVPARPSLLPARRVRDQVAEFARVDVPLSAHLRATSAGELVDRVLAALGLDDVARRRPAALSGGQAQRVAVARALAASAVVLLDEPTAAQDVHHAALVRALVRAHAQHGGAALLVGHQPVDALVVSDRLVVVEDGRVTQVGTPADVTAHPATPYVGRVVGATVLHGTVRDHVLSTAGGDLVVGDDVPDGPATAVVRPAAVTLHRDAPPGTSARNVLRGPVTSLDEVADAVTVQVATRPPLVARVTHASVANLALAVGRDVTVAVKAVDVDVHDAGSLPDGD